MITFIKPTDDLIKIMAKDMRKSDVIEVMASHGHAPLEALRYSFAESEHVAMAISEGTPVSMIGVSVSNIITGLGHPWLLSSNELFKHKEYLFKIGPVVINEMVAACPRLVNYVHHGNKTSIKWLKSLGFKIEGPEPYGVKGDLFHKFHMGVI